MKSFDVVVVGGGSNSLTTAAYMAKIGKSVLVLEKNAECGGGVTSMSPAPGFICDPHAAAMGSCIPNPIIAHDELGLLSKFGLEFAWPGANFGTMFDDGTSIITYKDVDKTCETIAKFSQRDAEAYKRFVGECQEILPLILMGYYTPPLGFGDFINLCDSSRVGQRLINSMLISAWDLLNTLFESPELKMHVLKWVGEMMISPEMKGTGIVPFILMGLMHKNNMGVVVGGSQNMTRALERCVESYGGKIRTNAEVVKINVSSGKATGVTLKDGEVINARDAVVGSIHPWDLGDMIAGLDPEVVRNARNVQLSDFGAINQQYALHEAPIWKAGAEHKLSVMNECIARDMTSMRRGFDEYRYGNMPKHLSPLISIPSDFDPTRAPPGKTAMYLYHFAPMIRSNGGLEAWDEAKEGVADAVFEEFCSYTTNMDKSKVIARHVESPLDHHRHSRSMKNGDIFGIAQSTAQLMGRRPTPELAQYKVPGLENFYLVGPFMHPGGTVTLGGRATAMKMVMDWKVDLETAFISF